MDKYENTILRRTKIIDEVFHTWLKSNGAKQSAKSLNYKSWEEGLLYDVSKYIMTEHLKMPYWEVTFNKTDEMKIIDSNLCDFIRNRYRNKMKDTYRIYRLKTNGCGF